MFMVKITPRKLLLIGFIFLTLGILSVSSLTSFGLLSFLSAKYQYVILPLLGIFLIPGGITLIIVGFINLTKKKILARDDFQKKSFLFGEFFSKIFIFIGVFFALIAPFFVVAGDGGPTLILSVLFFGITLLTVGIILRLRK